MDSRRMGGLVAVAVLGVGLLAAAPAGATDIYVVGGTDGFTDKTDIAQWNQLHPDIQIHAIDADFGKVQAMIAAGDPPDLIRVESRQVPGLAHQGLLEDITPYMQTSAYLPKNDMTWPVLDVDRINGKYYALIKDWSADLTLFYNAALFDNAGIDRPSETTPLTYDQVMQISHKLTKQVNGKYVQWGFGGGFQYLAFEAMIAAAGQSFYSSDGLSLDLEHNPAAFDAINWWAQMANRQWYDFGVPGNPWTDGKLGISQWGYWFGPISAIGAGPTVGDTQAQGGTNRIVGFAPAPTWKGQRLDMIVGTGFGMLAASKHKKEAWEVLEWFMDGPPSIARTKIGWGLPTRQSYLQYAPQASQLDRQRMAVTLKEIPYIKPQFQNAYDEMAFGDTWNAKFADLASSKVSPQEFLHNLDFTVTQAIRKGAGLQ